MSKKNIRKTKNAAYLLFVNYEVLKDDAGELPYWIFE
jgi:hypothetical protein|tara:strand:- start:129 stop:239 length:111 start_codon:yes stop_codon:yes gene_type:complete